MRFKGKQRASFLQVDRQLDRIFTYLLLLTGQIDLESLVPAQLGILQIEFAGFDLESLSPEDDLLGFLGQILGAIHLLELPELFLGVLEKFNRSLDHELGIPLGLRPVYFEELLQVLVGLRLGPQGGGQING